jgi:protease II
MGYTYQVPFLDVCNTLLDPSLPLTILDYEEFGNPQIQSNFDSIFSFSPYDNIPQGCCFPSVMVTAAVNDSRQSLSPIIYMHYLHILVICKAQMQCTHNIYERISISVLEIVRVK